MSTPWRLMKAGLLGLLASAVVPAETVPPLPFDLHPIEEVAAAAVASAGR